MEHLEHEIYITIIYAIIQRKSYVIKRQKKDYIEDLVVNQARSILTDENINKTAKNIVDLAEKESNNSDLKLFNKMLKDNEKQNINLINSLKICDIDSVRKTIFEELQKMQEEQKDIESKIKLEELKNVDITIKEIRFFLNAMKNGDVNNLKYRKLLVNVFINKVYLYDDHLIIAFNTQEEKKVKIDLSIDEINGSFLDKFGES